MQGSAIRHLAISDESAIVAAAFADAIVQMWSWRTGEKLGEFKTVLDFGGHRLALTPDGKTCIAASYQRRRKGRRGLAAYSIPDGAVLWLREDIPHIQSVRISGDGNEIYCGVEGSSAHIVETATGLTLRRMRAVTEIIGSQYSEHTLMVRKRPDVVKECKDGSCSFKPGKSPAFLLNGPCVFQIPPISFGLNDAAFSPDTVCISEPRDYLRPRENVGGIRMIDLKTGDVRCHLDIGSNHVAFNSLDRQFYCVSAPKTNPRDVSLIRLSESIFDCDRVALLGSSLNAAFSPSGRFIVTVEGDIFETSTGDLVMHLDFPERNTPSL